MPDDYTPIPSILLKLRVLGRAQGLLPPEILKQIQAAEHNVKRMVQTAEEEARAWLEKARAQATALVAGKPVRIVVPSAGGGNAPVENGRRGRFTLEEILRDEVPAQSRQHSSGQQDEDQTRRSPNDRPRSLVRANPDGGFIRRVGERRPIEQMRLLGASIEQAWL